MYDDPYEHVEWFKRFAKTYLMWSHIHMDQIVKDIIRRDDEAEAKRKEDARLAPLHEQMSILLGKHENKIAEELMKDAAFFGSAQWTTTNYRSQILNIKIPYDEYYKIPG